MTTRFLFACGILITGVAYFVVADDAVWVGLDAGDPQVTRETANQIERSLRGRTECNFVDEPLEEVVARFEQMHGIPIWLDKAALSDEGINSDQQVNLKKAGITLQTALALILEPLGLTHVTEDGVLKITTQAVADEKMTTRVYPVGDLVTPGTNEMDYDLLMALIENSSPSRWMEIDAEGGSLTAFPNARSLVIRQDQRSQRYIEGLLAALRKSKSLQRMPSIPTNVNDPEFLTPVFAPPRKSRAPQSVKPWQQPRVYTSE
ncbi:MAG: hypothetical protein JSS49_20405 [Planctomycetes bacterium]|nr:hypothetical protein [Planctomycetota bacterium]